MGHTVARVSLSDFGNTGAPGWWVGTPWWGSQLRCRMQEVDGTGRVGGWQPLGEGEAGNQPGVSFSARPETDLPRDRLGRQEILSVHV